MRSDLTSHLLIPFAASSAEGWLPALQALPPANTRQLGQLLQGMELVETDTQDANSLSPPHERALACAIGLASGDTADGLIPWAARDAAQRLPAGRDTAWAWITPCHWAMGHLHATLSDPAALALDEDESHALLAIMQPFFETDGITLHYLAPERWLAEGELFRALPTASLDRVLGRNVDAWLPDAPNAGPLRRLQNEMQMLLYTHPFNDGREARRQLPVNSFWVSGTGALPPQAEPALPPKVSVPRALAQAAFKEDWAAYAQAWGVLDAGEIAQLLACQRAGETVGLTLCSERSAQTFASRRASLRTRFSSLLNPVRPLDVLQQL
jgi:hypothetical protein